MREENYTKFQTQGIITKEPAAFMRAEQSVEAYRPVSYSGSETKETINIDTPKQEVANQTTESSSNIFVPIGVLLFGGVIVVLLKFKNKKL